MSSVLKALQRQSSPLVPQPNPIWLASATQPRGPYTGLVAVVLALLLFVLSAAAVWWWLQDNPAPTQETSALTPIPDLNQAATPPATPAYRLGEPTAIRVPVWPEPVAVTTAEPATVAETAEATAPVTANEANDKVISQGQGLDLNAVSPELLAAFEDALASGENSAQQSVVPTIYDLNLSMQRQIGSFSYDSHQYSSDATARWIVLDGRRLFEGDSFGAVTILKISPAHVVMSMNQQAFQLPALEDWTRP